MAVWAVAMVVEAAAETAAVVALKGERLVDLAEAVTGTPVTCRSTSRSSRADAAACR